MLGAVLDHTGYYIVLSALLGRGGGEGKDLRASNHSTQISENLVFAYFMQQILNCDIGKQPPSMKVLWQ